jgi:hypothetical protein
LIRIPEFLEKFIFFFLQLKCEIKENNDKRLTLANLEIRKDPRGCDENIHKGLTLKTI